MSKASSFPRRDSYGGSFDTRSGTTESDAKRTPTDLLGARCHLSEWSPWSPCTQVDLDTCSTNEAKSFWTNTPPRMWRTRHSITQSKNEDCLAAKLKVNIREIGHMHKYEYDIISFS